MLEVEKYKQLKKLISSFKKPSKYEKPEKTTSFRKSLKVFKSRRNVKLDFNCFFSCGLLIRPKTNDEVSSLEYERLPPYNLKYLKFGLQIYISFNKNNNEFMENV